MKRTLLASLVAAGTLVSAQSFAATYQGDENDTSWLPKANTAQTQKETGTRIALPQGKIIHYGDENDTSWLPTPAKR